MRWSGGRGSVPCSPLPYFFGWTNGSLLLYFGTICTSRLVPFSIARYFVTATPGAQTSLLYSRLLFHALLYRATMPHDLLHSYSVSNYARFSCVLTDFQMLLVLSVRCTQLPPAEISTDENHTLGLTSPPLLRWMFPYIASIALAALTVLLLSENDATTVARILAVELKPLMIGTYLRASTPHRHNFRCARRTGSHRNSLNRAALHPIISHLHWAEVLHCTQFYVPLRLNRRDAKPRTRAMNGIYFLPATAYGKTRFDPDVLS